MEKDEGVGLVRPCWEALPAFGGAPEEATGAGDRRRREYEKIAMGAAVNARIFKMVIRYPFL
jgi:hypothetical protein